MTATQNTLLQTVDEALNQTPATNRSMQSQQSLRYSVAEAMQRYFDDFVQASLQYNHSK